MKKSEKKLNAMLERDPGYTYPETTLNEKEVSNVKDFDAEKINNLHQGAINDISNGVRKFILVGELLLKKKSELPHGSFESWLDRNLTFSRASAGRYMKIAKGKVKIKSPDETGLREALLMVDDLDNEAETKTPSSEKLVNLTETQMNTRRAKEFYKKFRSGSKLTPLQKKIVKTFIDSEVKRIEGKIAILKEQSNQL
ncbi:DUF3102 domain-containing protein [Leptospira sp. 201903071]|uniref:DUF3102 domain-containing protein n=1 Tax=Leptospira ainazelensis TaxID=2810034 RepID=UPI0019653B6F|nr:DUF3102 domain-containing protein [Leptospira ainazelensis]MBM9502918.1 DUF3102 domain-containing protein [Leptospira ainazelensis]